MARVTEEPTQPGELTSEQPWPMAQPWRRPCAAIVLVPYASGEVMSVDDDTVSERLTAYPYPD